MKNIVKNYNCKVVLLLLVIGLVSCKDYLEVTPVNQISDKSVWQTSDQADLFLDDVYAAVPDGSNTFDPWENWSDDSMDGVLGVPTKTIYANSSYTPSNLPTLLTYLVSWDSYYARIRKSNLFIEKVTASNLPDDWKKLRLAEGRFLRAYFYTLLWTQYGGVPVITDVLNQITQGNEIFRPRNTSDETFKFITDECAAIANDLPLVAAQKGRVTKGAALTLKGWCELFNASPLHNPSNDKSKWALAAATNKAVIDLNVYSLFTNYETMFYEENNYNAESIFAKPHVGGTSIGNSIEGFRGATYSAGQTAYGMINPSQELIDEYVMANGLPITDSSSGYDPQNPYLNREKRFYQSIVYDGSVWNGAVMYSRQGVGSQNQMDLSNSIGVTKTGYYLRKTLNVKYAVNGANLLSSANMILFRYAEILLSYAEAQNEAVGPDASVYEAINKVRNRSSLPSLTAGLSQVEMRAAIWRERRVELAFEERRWYDLIRLKIAEKKLNGEIHGMKIESVNGKLVYTVIPAAGGQRIFFANKNYFLPIPQSAIDKNSKLVQNPNY